MKISSSIRTFTADPIFKGMRRPTNQMIKRAKFWAEWKKRQEAKQQPKGDRL